jgi:hypothetical protein
MPAIDLVLKLHRTGRGNLLVFDLSTQEARNAVWDFANTAKAKHNDFLRVMIDAPAKKVKTGPRGQVNRHFGHCADIAEQLTSDEHPVTKEMVDEYLRVLAVREEFPTFYNILKETVEPIHFNAQLSVANANIVELVKRRFADKFPLWLHEYIDPDHPEKGSYKSIQGRSYEEMKVYWKKEAENRERPK